MITSGVIESIHIGGQQGRQLIAVDTADVLAGKGISGDRYAAGAGFWTDARVSRALTLVESETVEYLAARFGIDVRPAELRRNITTRGVRLNDLVGRSFRIGEVLARGTSLCEPCTHLMELTGKPVLKPLAHRGGLRADALTSGRIAVGDRIELVPAQEVAVEATAGFE